jgi:hypothetical protein
LIPSSVLPRLDEGCFVPKNEASHLGPVLLVSYMALASGAACVVFVAITAGRVTLSAQDIVQDAL